MTWSELQEHVREWLDKIGQGEEIEFVAAAEHARVVVHAVGRAVDEGGPDLRLYSERADPTQPTPEAISRALHEAGWTEKDSVTITAPYDAEGVVGKIVHALRDIWHASPARWSFVGSDGEYGPALHQRPRDIGRGGDSA